jgi:hypothetical protein
MCYELEAEAMYVRRSRLFLDNEIGVADGISPVHVDFSPKSIIKVR